MCTYIRAACARLWLPVAAVIFCCYQLLSCPICFSYTFTLRDVFLSVTAAFFGCCLSLCILPSAVQGNFIPAQRFEGKKLGYFFSKGAHGLGYYSDAAQAVSAVPLHLPSRRSILVNITSEL